MGAENLANEAAITPGAIVRSSLLIPGPSKRTEGRLVHHLGAIDGMRAVSSESIVTAGSGQRAADSMISQWNSQKIHKT